MTYTFDWKDVVYGQIEIEADNGDEAERIFCQMTLKNRLEASKLDSDNGTMQINFVDVGFTDIHTKDEWEEIKPYV